MRVLLLVSELEDYTISFANGVARHVPVTLGVPKRRYAHLVRWLEPSVDVRLLDWPRHSSLANPGFLFTLTKTIREIKPDLIHLLSNTTLWLNFAAPFWRPIPLITTVHDVQVHPGDRDTKVLPSWATTLIVRQSNHVVVHGETLRRSAIAQFRKLPERVHVLPHPPILRYAELVQIDGMERRSKDEFFTVLLFGRIFAYKGLEQLIRAEAKLGQRIPNLRIIVAGRGDDPWALRYLMGNPERYEVRNRFIDDHEVAQLFLDADLVALPYTEASQSGVLNLAAAFGKPTVVTDVGELRATVERCEIGLIVPPNNPEKLAEAIALVAEHRDMRAKLGANARNWSEGANSLDSVGRQAASLYRTVLQTKQGS